MGHKTTLLVRGGGDLASGVIHRLYKCGYQVLVLECRKPSAIRRKVSFGEAVFDGISSVEGVTGRLIEDVSECQKVWEAGEIPILVDETGKVIKELRPDALIDAILAKRNLGTTREMAPLTVALGPGFEAGKDVDFVIETQRGHNLGRVIEEGTATPNTGIPGVIAGYGKERVIHSPAAGIMHNRSKIGDIVEKDQIIAMVDATPVYGSLYSRKCGRSSAGKWSAAVMQADSLLEALKINPEKYRVIAVVGGGGKTSLIFRLMEELVSIGKTVIVTTTTHMAYEPERPFVENGDIDGVRKDLQIYHYTVAASLDCSKGKIGCLSEEKLEELRGLSDVLLIEADGAKRLPLKVPEEWEPVIPELVDLLIGVVGMDALGEPIQKTCHRVEKVAKFLGKGIEETVTEDDIVKIAVSRDGLRKCVDEREYRVLLNKADIPGKAEAAERIAGKLEQQRVHVVWGSLQKEYYNSCDFAREKITLVMLAAGDSRRFGSNKLLYEIDGMPMYLRTLEKLQKAASELGDCEIIVVTQYEEIAAKANTLGVKVLINPQPERGISSSMQIGLATAKDSSACLFTVSDQPWLTAETIINLVDKFRDEQKGMACTIFGTKTGNPCIFSREYYQELMEITGDKGGKQIINRHPEDVTYFKIEDARELQDIDIPLG